MQTYFVLRSENFDLNRSEIHTQNGNIQIDRLHRTQIGDEYIKTRACADVFPRCLSKHIQNF